MRVKLRTEPRGDYENIDVMTGTSVKEIAEERRRKYAQSEVKPEPCHSLEIDPKKLVIYSEIMKPKFDDCR